ncbi:MAG: SGNH/GDSL hydrolase family protein [Candidatus Omnitrophica bacterium]|nr:SGNH/GDSL hydrolase family protein [Candidatus Omnitrophota bacterium]
MSLRQKLILIFISAAIALGVSEYVVRKFRLAPEMALQQGNIRFVNNLKMVYEYIPSSYVGPSRTNKQGFYDFDFTLEKPTNLIRIAMLGDSITQGAFVPLETTFSRRLEADLNQRARSQQLLARYEVMNFGVGGYNLEAEVEVLKEKAILYNPDVVVFNLYFNDNEPMPGVDLLFVGNYSRLTEQQQIDVIKKYVENRGSLVRWLERNIFYRSKLYLFVVFRLGNLNAARAKLSNLRSIPGQISSDMQGIYRGFSEIARLQREYGFKLLFCIHPNLLFGENENDMKFASIADSFHFVHFDMFPYYKNEPIAPESLQLEERPKDFLHPNEFGHALIARAMFLELKKYGLLDSRL